MTKKAILLLSIAFTTLFTAFAKVESELYPHKKELERAETAESNTRFGVFNIDEEIFESLNKTETNLRILSEDGKEVPFLIRTKTGERTVDVYKSIPFRKISFNKLPDNQIEIELEKDSEQKHASRKVSHISISSNLQNFEKSVTIWTSANRTDWSLLAENKPIFDYSKFIDISNSRISFPPTNAKYFRIRISNISEKQQSPFTGFSRTIQKGEEFSSVESTSFTRTDFKISEITFYEKTTEVVKDKILKQSYSTSQFSVTEIDKNSLINFATRKTPITKINLQTTIPFFYRGFRIEASDDQKNWRTIHSGIISKVSDDPDSSQSQSINLPSATRSEYYRITITNNDSPPLEISDVELEGETREIIFYSDKAKTYRLIYGAGESKKPVYDIAQVLRHTKGEIITQYKCGSQIPNRDFNGTTKHKTLLCRRTVITISVIIMIAVLGWLIAQVAKKIE